MSSKKTQARERAVLLLFESDSKEEPIESTLENLEVEPDSYVIDLLSEYQRNQKKVNDLIDKYSKGWSSARLPAFDRSALRMAITELVRSAEVPVGTIISEAVSLCEQYSTPDSPKFVNGLLSTVAHQVRGVELLNSAKYDDKSVNTSQDES